MRAAIRVLSAGIGVLVGAGSLAGCPQIPISGGSPSPSIAPGPPALELERTSILSALASGSFDPLFTSPLINDGIGIFSVNGGSAGFAARRWGREYESAQPELAADSTVYLSDTPPLVARIEFATPEGGVWLGDFPWLPRLVTKPIAEQFEREAIMDVDPSGQWTLAAVSPGIQQAQTATVGISDVALSGAFGTLDYSTASLPVSALPTLSPGQTVNVSLHATGASASAFVYGAGGERQELAYGGTDGIGMQFSGAIAFPSGSSGPAQVTVDVLDPGTLGSPQGAYSAAEWGVPVVRGGGL